MKPQWYDFIGVTLTTLVVVFFMNLVLRQDATAGDYVGGLIAGNLVMAFIFWRRRQP